MRTCIILPYNMCLLFLGRSTTLITLESPHVHLWYAYPCETAEYIISELFFILSASEQTQYARYFFQKDRNIYAITRIMLRSTLSQYEDVAPTEWQFSKTKYGRPYVASPKTGRHISFNISHADNCVLLAIAKEMDIGVDLERHQRPDVNVEIANEFLCQEEIKALSSLPDQEKHKRLLEYWVLKEAYAKAKGLGLSCPFQELQFQFENGQIKLARSENPSQVCDEWNFKILHPVNEFVAALAFRPPLSNAINVVLQTFPFLRPRS